ncbi:uncharacterized protein LOC133883092 [Alnus glutinosa]|uniref:uncharacterized protein LOC133883092 n=1 Tax=Alnus glutinosa TaxID=3517 RepID=UPI002D78DBDE|nr:uncharacterized protein LOC133883092 [Alnus glutinosa]XP_062178283.1 uncharacterized protein LOC133883092 [Alnus glutinosa]
MFPIPRSPSLSLSPMATTNTFLSTPSKTPSDKSHPNPVSDRFSRFEAYNHLQAAFREKLPITDIMALGGQSDGKSSLLEALLGHPPPPHSLDGPRPLRPRTPLPLAGSLVSIHLETASESTTQPATGSPDFIQRLAGYGKKSVRRMIEGSSCS